ncbi:MAG: hypothetical protein JRJ79_16655, partial [Deltaproteobacteria bacterium]|nr:hypothetical protein [Deltaproteobacteria bacterium]
MKTEEHNEMKSKIRIPHSAFRIPHSGFLSPVYFPFTFISPSLVEAMSLCFHRVVVYEPAHSKRQEAIRPWIDRDFLDVRSPFEKVIDKRRLEAALRNFRSWGLLHQHADMAYLKMVGNDIAPVDPKTPRIVSDIRAMAAKKNSKESEESELSLQLFIHLAQEFDQHSWELRQQMNRFNDQYQALQSSFREDEAGQLHEPISKDLPARASQWQAGQWQAGLFPVTGEDPGGFMIEKRMAAWNHLFQKDPADSSLLFTDSPLAFAYLLDGVQEKVEAFKFDITYNTPPSWADHLHEIFNTVLTTPWSRTLQERVVEAGREIEAAIDHLRESTVKPHDRSVSFRWYVLPH